MYGNINLYANIYSKDQSLSLSLSVLTLNQTDSEVFNHNTVTEICVVLLRQVGHHVCSSCQLRPDSLRRANVDVIELDDSL